MTGAGKSSFISLLTDQDIKIGHDLYSSSLLPRTHRHPEALLTICQVLLRLSTSAFEVLTEKES